jgi:hypothetical protein
MPVCNAVSVTLDCERERPGRTRHPDDSAQSMIRSVRFRSVSSSSSDIAVGVDFVRPAG